MEGLNMNLINGIVLKVLEERVKKSSELWELKEGEKEKTFFIYKVEAEDEGGKFETNLFFEEPKEIKKGYKFLH